MITNSIFLNFTIFRCSYVLSFVFPSLSYFMSFSPLTFPISLFPLPSFCTFFISCHFLLLHFSLPVLHLPLTLFSSSRISFPPFHQILFVSSFSLLPLLSTPSPVIFSPLFTSLFLQCLLHYPYYSPSLIPIFNIPRLRYSNLLHSPFRLLSSTFPSTVASPSLH